MSERPGFMVYFDSAPAFERLSDVDAGKLIKAVFSYASTGALMPLDGMTAMAFDLLRPRLDRDAEKYEQTIQRRRYGGYSKACRERGEDPLDYEAWLEHAHACTSMPTTTTATTQSTATTTTATTTATTAVTPSVKTATDTTGNSNGSGKGGAGGNPLTAEEEFERRRREGIAKVVSYGQQATSFG